MEVKATTANGERRGEGRVSPAPPTRRRASPAPPACRRASLAPPPTWLRLPDVAPSSLPPGSGSDPLLAAPPELSRGLSRLNPAHRASSAPPPARIWLSNAARATARIGEVRLYKNLRGIGSCPQAKGSEQSVVKDKRTIWRLSIISDFFKAVVNFIRMFFLTMFSVEKTDSYKKGYGAGKKWDGGPGGGSGRGPYGGGGGGGGSRGPRTLTDLRSNDHSSLPACGSCCG